MPLIRQALLTLLAFGLLAVALVMGVFLFIGIAAVMAAWMIYFAVRVKLEERRLKREGMRAPWEETAADDSMHSVQVIETEYKRVDGQ
jgi:hypothetical protein